MNNAAFPAEDGNFKRGAFKPIAIVIALLLAGGAGAFVFLGAHQEATALSKDEVNKEVQTIQLLPKDERTARWRKWAAVDNEPRLEQEAYVHLSWAKDKESIPSIIKGLASPDHAVRGTAAMALVGYGTPDADAAKPVLMKALTEADASDKPQIAWALVALKEPTAFDKVMEEYRLGNLGRGAATRTAIAGVRRRPAARGAREPIEKVSCRSLATDESQSVRQPRGDDAVVHTPDEKWTDTLITLVQDKEIEIARMRLAVGLREDREREGHGAARGGPRQGGQGVPGEVPPGAARRRRGQRARARAEDREPRERGQARSSRRSRSSTC